MPQFSQNKMQFIILGIMAVVTIGLITALLFQNAENETTNNTVLQRPERTVVTQVQHKETTNLTLFSQEGQRSLAMTNTAGDITVEISDQDHNVITFSQDPNRNFVVYSVRAEDDTADLPNTMHVYRQAVTRENNQPAERIATLSDTPGIEMSISLDSESLAITTSTQLSILDFDSNTIQQVGEFPELAINQSGTVIVPEPFWNDTGTEIYVVSSDETETSTATFTVPQGNQ